MTGSKDWPKLSESAMKHQALAKKHLKERLGSHPYHQSMVEKYGEGWWETLHSLAPKWDGLIHRK